MRRRLIHGTLALALLAGIAPVQASEGAPGESARRSRLQGAALLGRNRFVVGATVLVTRPEKASELFVTASDHRGRFRVDDLPDGDYRVEVRREGLLPVVKENVGLRFPSRAVVEVTMQPVGGAEATAPVEPAGELPAAVAVRGRVTSREGKPLADIPLRFARPDGREDPVVVRTGADGGFDLPPLSGGRWRLEARVVGFLPIWAELPLADDTELSLSLVPQPAGYAPSPLELMPAEELVAPPG
jgi:hypothetical protein